MKRPYESSCMIYGTVEATSEVDRGHHSGFPRFNVLAGDMSLVGPRPERPCFVEQLNRQVDRYDERLLIKPGMTGLAQVHYRYDQSIDDVKKKLRFDLLYVRRMCLMLDARILAWTMLVVVTAIVGYVVGNLFALIWNRVHQQ